MYGIPKDLSLDVFIGASLERICVGPYIMHFDFYTHQPQKYSESLKISVEGKCELLNELNEVVAFHDNLKVPFALSEDARNFLIMSGAIVTGYKIEAPHFLTLFLDSTYFNAKYKFNIYDSSDKYESFQIFLSNNEVIIV